MIQRFKKKEHLSAARLNELVDALNALAPLSGGDCISVQQAGNGTAISLALNQLLPRIPKFRLRYVTLTEDWTKSQDYLAGDECTEDGTLLSPLVHWHLYTRDPHPLTWGDGQTGDVVSFLPRIDTGNPRIGEAVAVLAGGTFSSPVDTLPAAVDFDAGTAQTDTWDRDDQLTAVTNSSTGDGVTIRLMTRERYVGTPDFTLYAYFREFTFDHSGKLAKYGEETEKIVMVLT